MELTKLLDYIHAIQVTGEIQRKDVSGIYYDSRKVKPGSIFVAIKGFNSDGHNYILSAINNGALAVILENNDAIPDEIFTHSLTAKILVENSRKALAELANAFYRDPSSKINLIGITGTNGKTTTSYLIKSIFELAGEKTGIVGTINNMIGDKEIKSTLTTPESNDLNELLFNMVNEGCKNVVMEVSSHSLVLNRVYSLNFKSGVFSNITSDHLDFHGDFDNYLKAKKILFDNLSKDSFAIMNLDDKSEAKLIKDCKAKIITYGRHEDAAFRILDIKFDLKGTSFILKHDNAEYHIHTKLIGEFNAYNAAAAFVTCYCSGYETDKIISGIENTKQVPGRFEVIGKEKKVVIDYSHTADSLEKCLLSLKEIVKNEKNIYTVFGCGGNRDKTKRPIMGKIASELSYRAIVTSDNPRFEDPFDIINDVVKGIKGSNYEIIENREEAIKKAIIGSEENSVVLIAGKGHEDYQDIKGVKNHFSDKETALKYL